jgi:hypothetical protein
MLAAIVVLEIVLYPIKTKFKIVTKGGQIVGKMRNKNPNLRGRV